MAVTCPLPSAVTEQGQAQGSPDVGWQGHSAEGSSPVTLETRVW